MRGWIVAGVVLIGAAGPAPDVDWPQPISDLSIQAGMNLVIAQCSLRTAAAAERATLAAAKDAIRKTLALPDDGSGRTAGAVYRMAAKSIGLGRMLGMAELQGEGRAACDAVRQPARLAEFDALASAEDGKKP